MDYYPIISQELGNQKVQRQNYRVIEYCLEENNSGD